MRCLVLVLSLLALSGSGCGGAVDAAGASGSSPRPIAWQHFCGQVYDVAQANALAQASGAAGWELAALYNGVMCFKRPAPATREPAPAYAGRSQAPLPAVREPGF